MSSISAVKILHQNKDEFLEIPYTEYFYHVDAQSYKRWSLKKSTQVWKNGAWESLDLILDIFSTGKVCLCGKIIMNSQLVTLHWKIELLDIDKQILHTIHFAPVIFNHPARGKARRVNFKKRIRAIDLSVIPKIAFARLIPE